MKVSTKVSTAFSVGGLILLVIGIGAIFFIEQLRPLLTQSAIANRNLGLVANAIRDLRAHPDAQAQNQAWLDDLLQRWTESDRDRQLLQTARAAVVERHDTSVAVQQLEQLQHEYLERAGALETRLVELHQYGIYGVVAAVAAAVLLLVFLMFLIRVWLLDPLEKLRQTSLQLAGQPDTAQCEIAQTGQALDSVASALQALREKAAQSERLAVVGERCAHVTNNLRHALRSILSVARYQANQAETPPPARDAFRSITANIAKLESWIRDLHVSVAPPALQTAVQPVEPVLRDVLSLFAPVLRKHELRVDLQLVDDLPRVALDRALTEQALFAVLDNAIAAAPPGSTLTIRSTTDGGRHAQLEITDEGQGMTDQVRERACDPFFTTKPQGIGLGLTMAREVMKRHGGQLTLHSQPNTGTRVTLTWPAAGQSR